MPFGSLTPAHLVLGGLGAGKTTTILELLKSAPSDQTWAVFVNEFGRVAIDPGLFDGPARKTGKLVVYESAGGCICCSAELDLEEGIKELIRRYNPDRIFIEPTGLSDPYTLKTQITQRGPKWGIRLNSTIGVIDVRMTRQRHFGEMPFWRALLQSSDHVLASKTNRADEDTLIRFAKTIADCLPSPKPIYLQLADLAASDWSATANVAPPTFQFLPDGHSEKLAHGFQEEVNVPGCAARRFVEHTNSHVSIGWIFQDGIRFNRSKLLKCISDLLQTEQNTIRVKGLFHMDDGWQSIQSAAGDVPDTATCSNQEDSRLEIILQGKATDMAQFESALVSCVI